MAIAMPIFIGDGNIPKILDYVRCGVPRQRVVSLGYPPRLWKPHVPNSLATPPLAGIDMGHRWH